MNQDIYQELILERYKEPHNRGRIEGGVEASEGNLMCGDKISITLKIEKGKVVDAKFSGGGCAISMAAADLLLDSIRGKKVSEIKRIKGSQIEEMLGVELTPVRKKCAYLILDVLKKIG